MHPHSRRRGAKVAGKARHQKGREEVRAGQAEGGFRCGRIEALRAGKKILQAGKGFVQRQGQRAGEIGRFQPLAVADQDRIAQGVAQAGEGGGHGGLRQADPTRGAGHRPLTQQGVKDAEQVQIEAG